MKYILLVWIVLIVALNVSAQKSYEYPIAPKDSIFNTYFEEVVYDPYQWMENPIDPRLSVWLEEQKRISKKQERRQSRTSELHAQLSTMYSKIDRESLIRNKVKSKSKQPKYEFEYKAKEAHRNLDMRYKRHGDTNFKYVFRAKDFQRDKDDNVHFATRWQSASEDTVAVEVTHNGGDWSEVFFFDLSKGMQLADTLKYLRFNSHLVWFKSGVYYDGYIKPKKGRELLDKAEGQTLYYHKIGTSQSDDHKLYQFPDQSGTNHFSFGKVDDERLILHHHYEVRGRIYRALSTANMNDKGSFLLNNFLVYPNSEDIGFSAEAVKGDTIYLKTNWNAPNEKIVRANLKEKNKLEEFIPEFDVPLREFNKFGKDQFVSVYRNQGQFLALIYNKHGELLKRLDFPVGKKVNDLFENDPEAEYTDFSLSSFYHPDLSYRISLKDFSFKPIEAVYVPYKTDELETRYIHYTSKDGTQVPMYITCKKDLKLDGKNPTLIYGYGGYGIAVEPNFDKSEALWLLHGGVLAVPNIRGGGAAGDTWGEAGRRLRKQNAIDDFNAAAEYLIENNYTKPEKIVSNGASHGGLLVASAAVQRPELYKAVIAEAGVYDMLRFGKYTAGLVSTNILEFGTVTDSLDYLNLKSYSPLHLVKEGINYPNFLLITGDSDDRVPPFHTYKFLATLQEIGLRESLYHMYIVPGSGHGGALTSEDFTNKLLFKYYFLFDQLGVKFW
ncbi:prolyl oligopeptidase family serine peptidase [Fulvivirga lutimaris]|uniref:prolyl oligopeptidase family serine peptidase n=1 Tax=Fulvivirga lutimaris TaxID=1819566 RepID=UPI0012BB7E38|nr:prolyl oligopeptidase family serine peptidase [Fulvivirga lutimaris]MTI41001.1 S9 family peptidase [Fulvivirga lutimaris]